MPGGTRAGGGGDEPERDPPHGPPLLPRGRPQFRVSLARDVSFPLLGGRGARPLPRLARAPPLRSSQHFLLTSGAVKRHAIYSIPIFKPAIQEQGLGRGSSSTGAPGGGCSVQTSFPPRVSPSGYLQRNVFLTQGKNGKF